MEAKRSRGLELGRCKFWKQERKGLSLTPCGAEVSRCLLDDLLRYLRDKSEVAGQRRASFRAYSGFFEGNTTLLKNDENRYIRYIRPENSL